MKGVMCGMKRDDSPPPRYYEPPEGKPTYCPVCNQEAMRLYRGMWNDIIGCDNCVKEIDVDEYSED